MKYSELENKIVVDKKGRKVGKIVRIDVHSSMDKEEAVFFAIIHIAHTFRRNHYFPMPLDSHVLTQVEENILSLDMTRKEFDKIVKRYDVDRKIKARTAKLKEASAQDKAIALSAWARF